LILQEARDFALLEKDDNSTAFIFLVKENLAVVLDFSPVKPVESDYHR
jgi:hypothetical protein